MPSTMLCRVILLLWILHKSVTENTTEESTSLTTDSAIAEPLRRPFQGHYGNTVNYPQTGVSDYGIDNRLMPHTPERSENGLGHSYHASDRQRVGSVSLMPGSVPVNAYHNPTTGLVDRSYNHRDFSRVHRPYGGTESSQGSSGGMTGGIGNRHYTLGGNRASPFDLFDTQSGLLEDRNKEGSLGAALNTLWTHKTDVYTGMKKQEAASLDKNNFNTYHNTPPGSGLQSFHPSNAYSNWGNRYKPGLRPHNSNYAPQENFSFQNSLNINQGSASLSRPAIWSDQNFGSNIQSGNKLENAIYTNNRQGPSSAIGSVSAAKENSMLTGNQNIAPHRPRLQIIEDRLHATENRLHNLGNVDPRRPVTNNMQIRRNDHPGRVYNYHPGQPNTNRPHPRPRYPERPRHPHPRHPHFPQAPHPPIHRSGFPRYRWRLGGYRPMQMVRPRYPVGRVGQPSEIQRRPGRPLMPGTSNDYPASGSNQVDYNYQGSPNYSDNFEFVNYHNPVQPASGSGPHPGGPSKLSRLQNTFDIDTATRAQALKYANLMNNRLQNKIFFDAANVDPSRSDWMSQVGDVVGAVSNQVPTIDQAVTTMSFLAFGIFMANLVVQAFNNGSSLNNLFGRGAEDLFQSPLDFSSLTLDFRSLDIELEDEELNTVDRGMLKQVADIMSEVYISLHELARAGMTRLVNNLEVDEHGSRIPSEVSDLDPTCVRRLLCEGHHVTSPYFNDSTSYRLLPFWTVGVTWLNGDTNVPRLLEDLRAEVAGQHGLDCAALFPDCVNTAILDKYIAQIRSEMISLDVDDIYKTETDVGAGRVLMVRGATGVSVINDSNTISSNDSLDYRNSSVANAKESPKALWSDLGSREIDSGQSSETVLETMSMDVTLPRLNSTSSHKHQTKNSSESTESVSNSEVVWGVAE